MIPAMACVEFIFTLFPAPPFCRISALLQLVEYYTILSILTHPIFMKICSQGIFMRLYGSYLFTQAFQWFSGSVVIPVGLEPTLPGLKVRCPSVRRENHMVLHKRLELLSMV